MRTETIKIYKFNELPEETKQKAIENLRYINVDYRWWDFIYDDAESIGLNITEFDEYRIKGYIIESGEDTAINILREHGKETDTYNTAREFVTDLGVSDEREDEFLYALLEDYRVMLNKEYEYLTSEEAIIETIKINDYEFTADGKIY